MESQQVKIENGQIVITLPLLNPPRPSQSGKTQLIATTGGFSQTITTHAGKPVSISVNATVPNR